MTAEKRENLLVQVLRKIPLFKGLSPVQIRKILGLCLHKVYEPNQVVCRSGAPSDELYILLSGELGVVTGEGVKVAAIAPVTTVGEMGIITAQPRSATVEAVKASNLFVLHKQQFDVTLREDVDLQVQVFHNIIEILSAKLDSDNGRLRGYQLEKERLEQRFRVLDRRIAQHQRRTEAAIELALQHTGVTRDELEFHIEDKVKDLVPRVLIADDEEGFRRLVKEALGAFEVVEAENGKRALDLVHAEKLDLVITDIKMPVMDGFALQDTLRTQFPDLPVVAVSGYADAEEVKKHAFAGFVDKPVSLQQLQALVEEVLRQKAKKPSAQEA